MAQVKEVIVKQRMARRYVSKVRVRIFQVGDLVLKKGTESMKKRKLTPNKEELYKIKEEHKNGAYKLGSLDGVELPRTWNIASLKSYYS